MKKILVVIAMLLVVASCSASSSKETLKVYNWGVYIDEDVISMFEKENNVTVIYSTYDSNESMYTKLQSGESFDVLVPSDYMIQRLIAEDFLQTIDTSVLENYDGISESLKGQEFDPADEYSVPYFWGNVGILYNTETVSESDLETQGWAILKNSSYKGDIFMYNSERDSFMIALKNLGYSMNTSDETEIQAAYNWLIDQKKQTAPIYGGDEIIDQMVSGVKSMAVMYSGDATYIISENEALDYYVPKEGTNLWTDSMVIPANATNPELAMKWIDYMLNPEIALMNTVEVGYTSSVQSVIDEVSAVGGDYEGISSYIPRTGDQFDEVFHYDSDLASIMSGYWSKVLASN